MDLKLRFMVLLVKLELTTNDTYKRTMMELLSELMRSSMLDAY